jgi:hypothetical protein
MYYAISVLSRFLVGVAKSPLLSSPLRPFSISLPMPLMPLSSLSFVPSAPCLSSNAGNLWPRRRQHRRRGSSTGGLGAYLDGRTRRGPAPLVDKEGPRYTESLHRSSTSEMATKRSVVYWGNPVQSVPREQHGLQRRSEYGRAPKGHAKTQSRIPGTGPRSPAETRRSAP